MTAIQQMIDFINNINDNDRSEFNYYYDHIMEKLNELLEIEKQQMSSQVEISDDRTKLHWKTSLVIHTPKEISEESWEGCDGCTEQDEVMYKNGYVKGYNAAIAELPKEISDEEIVKAFTIGTNQKTEYTHKIEGAKWYREKLKNKQ